MSHTEMCLRCGRNLKNQPWVGIHYGKVCASKLGITVTKNTRQARKQGRDSRTKAKMINYEQLSIGEEIKKAADVGERIGGLNNKISVFIVAEEGGIFKERIEWGYKMNCVRTVRIKTR